MPYPNEHSARLKSPDSFDEIRVRRTNGSGEGVVQGVKIPGSIAVIWYIIKSDGQEVPVAQSLRFPISEWTESEAKAWLKKNEIKHTMFEPASEKSDNQTYTSEDFHQVIINEDYNFSNKRATVLLDKEAGVTALVCKLSDKDVAAIKMISFPKENFKDQETVDDWIKDHPLSNLFVKQLLYTGRWKHPQNPDKWVRITTEELKSTKKNVSSYLNKGGRIPVVYPPHPHEPIDKIEQNVGYLCGVFQWSPNDLTSVLELNGMASGWIREGKVKDVSPSMVYDVHTARGVFDVLFDHICITPDPYLIGQSEFQPFIAQRYSKAVTFFAGNLVSYEDSRGDYMKEQLEKAIGGLWASVKSLKGLGSDALKSIKAHISSVAKAAGIEPPNFEEEHKEEKTMTDEEKKEMETLKTENADLKEKIKTSEDKSKTSEDKLTKIKEDEDKEDLESFKGEIEQMVKDGQVKPTERDQLIAQYESYPERRTVKVEYGDIKLSIKDSLIAPYKDRPKKMTTKVNLESEIGKIRVKSGQTFDRESVKGRNEFHDYCMASISEMDVMKYSREHKVNKDVARSMVYAEKRETALAESETITGGE